MDYQKLADRLFPDLPHDTEYYEKLYPARDLPEKAEVLRMAPSPTGFVHLGNLYGAFADERIAHQSGGIFYLRIEDTDLKRRVEGAVEAVIENFAYFGLRFDEGAEQDPEGNYGPYYQRARADIYHAYAHKLISEGKAYPCFCTEDELNAIREKQTELKQATGYYGEWARDRNLSYEEVCEHLDKGEPFVIRLRAEGDPEKKHTFHDEIKGDIVVTENNQDVVLLKTDGIPTYHFAHAVDDHLMHTTTVLRGEEWLGSLPIHIELFDKLGFKMPKFAHTTVLMKVDNGVKRKLSKRKDPELSLSYYRELGYHPQAVKIYMLTLLNWNFEQWYLGHPDTDVDQFPFSLSKCGQSGALFDLDKLNNISKAYLSRFSLADMKAYLKDYAEKYAPAAAAVCFADEEKLDKILTLGMGLNLKKRRKDYICARQILDGISFYFRESFHQEDDFRFDKETVRAVLNEYLREYDHSLDNGNWFEMIKHIAAANGFASEMNEYKAAPENYRGSVADIAEIVRVAVTGRRNSPDLWTIQQIIGEAETRERVQQAIEKMD